MSTMKPYRRELELARLREENQHLLRWLQLIQPEGSPPPGGPIQLAEWIALSVGQELHRLREQRDKQAAKQQGERLYVASRASLPARPAMWLALRAAGWPIVSSWIDESGAGETDDFGELWARIEAEIRSASGLILYAETEDLPLKGALIECGMALGMGKRVAAVLPGVVLEPRSMRPVGSWLRHPLVSLHGDVHKARAALAGDGHAP